MIFQNFTTSPIFIDRYNDRVYCEGTGEEAKGEFCDYTFRYIAGHDHIEEARFYLVETEEEIQLSDAEEKYFWNHCETYWEQYPDFKAEAA